MLPSEEPLLVSHLPCRVDASAAVMMLCVPHILYYYVFLLLPTCVLQRRTGTHIGSSLHINDVNLFDTFIQVPHLRPCRVPNFPPHWLRTAISPN